MIYLGLLFVISAMAFFFALRQSSEKQVLNFIRCSLFLMCILIAFRGESVGADTPSYHRMFYSVIDMIAADSYMLEKGNYYLFKILSKVSENAQIVFIFEAVLIYFSHLNFIKKNVDNMQEAYLTILGFLTFGLFSFYLTGVRQTIAICICLYSYQYIKERKMIKFIILIIVASFFHTSAWFFACAYIISALNLKNAKIFVGLFVFIAMVNMQFVFQLMSMLGDRYEKYGIEETGNGLIFLTIIILITILVELFKDIIMKNSDLLALYSINYICLALWILRLVSRTAERPSLYFLPSTIILMSKLPKCFKHNKDGVIVFLGISICIIVLFIYRMFRIPYEFYF